MTEQPVAIVTGAGSGIGKATALLLADAAYRIVLVGRTRSKLEDTARQISTAHGDQSCRVVAADLTDAASGSRVLDEAIKGFGRIDALANVAGVAPLGPIDDITPGSWRQTIDGNLSYVVHLTAACWPHLRAQGSGVIVNVSSMASIDPFPGFAMYAAAKAGVNLFTLVTGREGEQHGIRAVCIAPGAVETPMLRSLFSRDDLPPERTLKANSVAALIRDCVTGRRTFEPGETIQMPSP